MTLSWRDLKGWSLAVCSVVATAPDVLSPLSLILESVLKADQQMVERTKTKVLSALISVLQIQGLNGETCCCQLILKAEISLQSYGLSLLSTRRRHFPATSVTVVCVWDGERRGHDSYWCHRSPEPKWWAWGWGEHGDGLPTQLTERPKRRSELTHLIVFTFFFFLHRRNGVNPD